VTAKNGRPPGTSVIVEIPVIRPLQQLLWVLDHASIATEAPGGRPFLAGTYKDD